MKSIMQDVKVCWFCGTDRGLHRHHIFGGANRRLSEKYGLWVYLCGYHHNLGGADSVHYNAEINSFLRQTGQIAFEHTYPELDFMKIFGRNYK